MAEKNPLEPRQGTQEKVQGAIVLGVMLWGLWKLVRAAMDSGNFWFKAVMVVFLGSLLLWGGIMVWLATCQWLDKRRCAREGRPWQP